MQKLLIFVVALLFIAGCSNSQTTSTQEKKDSAVTRDTSSHTETNTVTPPASNGQY